MSVNLTSVETLSPSLGVNFDVPFSSIALVASLCVLCQAQVQALRLKCKYL